MIFLLATIVFVELAVIFILIEVISRSMERDIDVVELVERYRDIFFQDRHISIRGLHLFDEFKNKLNKIYNDNKRS